MLRAYRRILAHDRRLAVLGLAEDRFQSGCARQKLLAKTRKEGQLRYGDCGRRYPSIWYPERLIEAEIENAVGRVRKRHDNGMADSMAGLYKTEIICQLGPRESPDEVEYTTLEWVNWDNYDRL